METVSVVISTFNRFNFLLKAIESAKSQTYKNIEIIVVNDGSTQKEYYEHKWEDDDKVKIVHLEKNTKELFGFPCPGYVRNKGIENSTGKYVAFCDDDDMWFPSKIQLQLDAMKASGCRMSCTEGLYGYGLRDPSRTYKKFNTEHHYAEIRYIYKQKGSDLLDNGFPDIFTLEFVKVHNVVITSSVLMERELLSSINMFKNVRIGQEDYDCWLRALEHTNSAYVKEVCFYYGGN
jgi:glycosyltransferase involved in cell wall biosynthesis